MSKWQKKTISEISKLSAGGTPSTDRAEYWENGTVPWMASGEVHRKRIFFTEKMITELGLKNSSAKLFPSKTILIALAGQGKTRGTVAISEAEITTNQSIAGVMLKDKEVLPDYVFYNLDNRYEELRNISTGGGREGLNLQIIADIEIDLPPLPEQKKIAEILTSVDRVIELTSQEIDKLKDLKKGMMQELLTKGIGHTKFKDSPVGKIPESWECKKFEDVTDFIRCGVASTPVYVEEGVPFLSAQNVQGDKVVLEKFKNISQDFHDKLTKNAKPQRGDILYSRVGAGFGQAALVEFDWEFSVYVSLSLIRINNKYDSKFFVHQLNSPRVKELAKNTVFQGGGVPNLNVEVTKEFWMIVPPKKEQQRITLLIDTISNKIDQNQDKFEKLCLAKKGLMNELLTGRVRVHV